MNRRGTRLRVMLAGVLILMVLSTACYAGNKDKDPPKFFVRDRTFDAGEVYEGQDINHVYKVRNNGSGELHIINVRPG
jgi:hypothetical protein